MAVTGRTEDKAEIAAALAATPTETAREFREIKRDRAMTEEAWNILAEAGPEAYERALAALRPQR